MLASIALILGVLALSPQSSAPLDLGMATPVASPAGRNDTAPTAARPYGLKVPAGYDHERPAPLVVLLHGYSSNGAGQDAYFGLSRLADQESFILATPDGTRDLIGNRFWNATDACCDFFHSGVDDLAYLDAVIDEISGRYHVDTGRVFLVGHSNGAFMAHRFACDRSSRVAAIVTLAGMQWHDQAQCEATSPVSVLHVHGRQDEVVRYDGGATPKGRYPGATRTADAWAAKNACTGTLELTGQRLDLEARVVGEETTVARHSGCRDVDVELWTIEGGGHVPAFNGDWAERIWAFAARHPKAGLLTG